MPLEFSSADYDIEQRREILQIAGNPRKMSVENKSAPGKNLDVPRFKTYTFEVALRIP